jgi:hypothetical protein
LLDHDRNELLAYKNFGKTSLRILTQAISDAIIRKDIKTATCEGDLNRTSHETSLEESVSTALRDIKSDRNRKLVEKRLGKYGKIFTLEELGRKECLTRERVRQIVDINLDIIRKRCNWVELLQKKLGDIISNRENPLLCDLIEIEDEWFSGFGDNPEYLISIITNFSNGNFGLIRYGEKNIISRIDQTAFDELLVTCRSILEDCSKRELRKSDVHLTIEVTMKHHNVLELSSLIFDKYGNSLIYVNSEEDDKRLIAFGPTVENFVKSILHTSSTPLHYQMITSIARKLHNDRDLNVRNVRTAAVKVAYLFGPGVYGLYKHVPLSERQVKNVLNSVEGVILNNKPAKQWHCSELIDLIKDEHFDIIESIDSYLLNIILEQSKNLTGLGRRIWISKRISNRTFKRRIDLKQAFEMILEEYGEPLKTEELKELLSDSRGIQPGLQIHSSKRMIKLEPGLWGLIDRDVYLNNDQIAFILDKLYSNLKSVRKAIHVTELDSFLKNNGIDFPENAHPYLIMSLSTLDERFKTTIGGFLALKTWDDIGRLTISEAIQRIVNTMNSAMSLEQIIQRTRDLTEREVDRYAISRSLVSLNVKFNNDRSLWFPPEKDENAVHR